MPKNKVVDHFVLYNFYFGQISCCHMKFGVLEGQNWVKILRNFTVASLFSPVHRRSRRRRCHASRRRAHRRLSAPLPSWTPSPASPLVPLSSHRVVHAARPSRAELIAGVLRPSSAAVLRPKPPRVDSPHPTPPQPLPEPDFVVPRPESSP